MYTISSKNILSIEQFTSLVWNEPVSIAVQLHLQIVGDVLPINNPEFENYLCHMISTKLEIKDTMESNISASHLDLLRYYRSVGTINSTSLYDKRDNFGFNITNFPFLFSYISSSLAYGVLSHSSYDVPGLAPLMNGLLKSSLK